MHSIRSVRQAAVVILVSMIAGCGGAGETVSETKEGVFVNDPRMITFLHSKQSEAGEFIIAHKSILDADGAVLSTQAKALPVNQVGEIIVPLGPREFTLGYQLLNDLLKEPRDDKRLATSLEKPIVNKIVDGIFFNPNPNLLGKPVLFPSQIVLDGKKVGVVDHEVSALSNSLLKLVNTNELEVRKSLELVKSELVDLPGSQLNWR